MKKATQIYLTTSIITVLLFSTGCKGNRHAAKELSAQNFIADTMTIDLHIANVDTMKVAFKGTDTTPALINKEDRAALAVILARANYKRQWNLGGIMVKMLEPDYTITISYYNDSPEQYEYLPLWINDSLMKYGNRWYYSDEEELMSTINILEGYRR